MTSDLTNSDPLAALNEAMATVTQGGDVRTIADLRIWTESLQGLVPTVLPEVGRFDGELILGEVDGRPVVADLVAPEGDGPFPVMVYLHGGGWVLGSRESYRPVAFAFAQAGYLVISVDYALAPECPFPAGFDDCAFAVRWAAAHAAEHGGDPQRLVVAGDSAGANLTAAVTASFADDPTAPTVRAVLLFYGVYDMPTMPRGDTEASAVLCDEITHAYLGAEPGDLLHDPRVSPIHAAHRLPPAFVAVGAVDELVLQAGELDRALTVAGVIHQHVVVEGMPHAFLQLPVPAATDTIKQAVEFLAEQLAH